MRACPLLAAVLVSAACSSSGVVATGAGPGVDAAVPDSSMPDASAGDASPMQGGPCVAGAGAFPNPACDDATGMCGSGGCPIDEAMCGSKVTCLPMANNAGRVTLDFRMRRVTVVSPAALASNFVQNAVFDQSVSLKAPTCGELGDGGLNWLLRIDRAAGTLKTGGALPAADPFGVGYCFATQAAFLPATATTTFNGNTFATGAFPALGMPVFVSANPNQTLLLPLRDLTFRGVAISSDSNCIGSFNASALDGHCSDSRGDCSKWRTAGALGAFITLEDADAVPIPQLGNKTLCVLLTGSAPGPDALHCKRDSNNKIAFSGDYCSTTKTAGACADSYWFAATFAASAVKICP